MVKETKPLGTPCTSSRATFVHPPGPHLYILQGHICTSSRATFVHPPGPHLYILQGHICTSFWATFVHPSGPHLYIVNHICKSTWSRFSIFPTWEDLFIPLEQISTPPLPPSKAHSYIPQEHICTALLFSN